MKLLFRLILFSALVFPAALLARTEQNNASLNMRDADIRVVIDLVSEITGRNFIVDPRVKGKVTVVWSHPMDKEGVYDVFLSILQVHGFTTIPAGSVTKIVPDSSARHAAVPTDPEGQLNDEFITRVLVLQHVPVAKIVPVLKNLVPQQSTIGFYEPGNALIISDRSGNIERIERIIQRIDKPDNQEIEVIRLEHASAGALIGILDGLLDKTTSQSGVNDQKVVADERTNSIMIRGNQTTRLRIRGLIAHLDIPLETEGNYKVIFLRYIKVKELVQIISGLIKPNVNKAAAASQEDINIQADETNNALIVQAPPDVLRNVQSLVRQLDIRRAQVLVEAVIAEVSSDISKELGVQIAVAGRVDDDNDIQAPVALTNLGPGPIAGLVQGIITQTLTLGAGGFLGLGDFGSDSGTNWAILINALAGDAATNILSTPTIVATDNQEAEIVVGQNVPFITGQYTNTGATTNNVTNPFQTIERKDIGISLKIRPLINEGSSIQLDIEQEVSSLAASSVIATDLITNKRMINTTVTVEDGQIIVLGGLIEDTSQNTEQKIPFLGDIPALGNLFRYDSTKKVKQNLMVFLRPVILRDPQLASSYSARKYSQLRRLQTDMQSDIGKKGWIKERPPQLPEKLDDLFDPSQALSSAQGPIAERAPQPPERQDEVFDPWNEESDPWNSNF